MRVFEYVANELASLYARFMLISRERDSEEATLTLRVKKQTKIYADSGLVLTAHH